MAAQPSSHGLSKGYVVLSESSSKVSPDANACVPATESLEGSIADLAAAFKARTALLKSDPSLNFTKETKVSTSY